MRYTSAAVLTLLIAPWAAGADRPIPQDHARMEQRSRERLEWNRRTLRGAYDRVGKKDPRWDEPARKALDLAARMFALQVDPLIRLADIHAPARQAVDAGCDDPLILYLYARSSVGPHYPKPEEFDRRIRAAAAAMAAGAYPPYRRAVAVTVLAELDASKPDLSPRGRREVERGLDAALDLLPASVAEDPRGVHWEDAWYREINTNIAIRRQLTGDYKAAFDAVDARLAGARGIDALRLAVRGSFFIYWGWEARTNAFARDVTAGQFRSFESRLGEARKALEAAWRLRPDQPYVATLMLDVEKGIGGGDRAAMETWFERAMTADGNDLLACQGKLDWLDPKWYGGDSPEEMMAFGKACRATKNWRAGITLLAADAHLRYFSKLPEGQERTAYMRSPEVWDEIRSVYDECLRHYPDDDLRRSKYAFLCFLGGHYREAHAQFQAVGDRLTTWPIFPNVPLERLKAARDYTARVVAGPASGKGAPASKGVGAKAGT